MPWTQYSENNASADIAGKKALYQQIALLKSASNAHLNAVIELNPYIVVQEAAPLRIRFSECNAFFRDVSGRYVSDVN